MSERHLLALSGGKDSAALAVYMREKYPDLPLEYIFIDSGCELPETYAYLNIGSNFSMVYYRRLKTDGARNI